MSTELILKFEFVASHSLENNETPHPHRWKLELAVTGSPIRGKIIDLVLLRDRVQALINPLRSVYLNDFVGVSPAVQAFPTCETLGQFFWDQLHMLLSGEFYEQNPTLKLASVMVGICEMSGEEMGAARIQRAKTLVRGAQTYEDLIALS